VLGDNMNQPVVNVTLAFFTDGYSTDLSFDLSTYPAMNDSPQIMLQSGTLASITGVMPVGSAWAPMLASGTANIIGATVSGTILTFTFDGPPGGAGTLDEDQVYATLIF